MVTNEAPCRLCLRPLRTTFRRAAGRLPFAQRGDYARSGADGRLPARVRVEWRKGDRRGGEPVEANVLRTASRSPDH